MTRADELVSNPRGVITLSAARVEQDRILYAVRTAQRRFADRIGERRVAPALEKFAPGVYHRAVVAVNALRRGAQQIHITRRRHIVAVLRRADQRAARTAERFSADRTAEAKAPARLCNFNTHSLIHNYLYVCQRRNISPITFALSFSRNSFDRNRIYREILAFRDA